jgi:Leucine-rich repeat (LRR) protein
MIFVKKQLNTGLWWPKFIGVVFGVVGFVIISSSIGSGYAADAYDVNKYELSQGEYDALYGLYNSTNGPDWKWVQPYDTKGYPWNFFTSTNTNLGNPCYQWQGVTCSSNCSNSPCYVQRLELSQLHLNGSLPSIIGQLTLLNYLDVSVNGITSSLPTQLGFLTAMEQLLLNNNNITGVIPTEIGLLTLLGQFVFNSNQFYGSLPSQLGQLINLVDLAGNFNSLSGRLPTQLGALTILEILDIGSNEITGPLPTECGQLRLLTVLTLTDNRLSMHLPTELGLMSSLLSLFVDENVFSGPIPSEIFQLPMLIEVDFSVNRLDGSIPTEVGNARLLLTFIIGENRLSGTLPTQLAAMKVVGAIFIGANNITGPLFTELGMMTQLIDLYIESNQCSGGLPSELGNLVNLEGLVLDDLRLSGTIPTEFGKMKSVTGLKLSYNRLTSTIPTELTVMRGLESFICQVNFLEGTLPTGFANLDYLTEIDLFGNLLTNTIPSILMDSISIQALYLDYNRFTGTICTEIGYLATLQIIYLSGNHITGSIASEMGRLEQLSDVFFNFNMLTHTIPSEFGRCVELTDLYLNDNSLTSTIPSSLGDLPYLSELYLDTNLLNGTLPSYHPSFQQLQYISLLGNSFSGDISSIAEWAMLSEVNLQGNRFTGSFPSRFSSSSIETIQLQNNFLSGNASTSSLEYLPFLQVLNLANNRLSGTFPWSSLQDSVQYVNISSNQFAGVLNNVKFPSSLTSLDVSQNQYSGQLPSMGGYSNLEVLYLTRNAFTGSMDDLVDLSSQGNLGFIDLSYNQLTGAIADSIFELTSLKSIVLTGNCITGSLPASICLATNMTSLVLDGMSSNPKCNAPLYPSINTNFYLLSARSSSAFPACLLTSFHRIATLHLSGLGLYGSLPSAASLPRTLRYLSLSNNYLSGEIPSVFFSHPHWEELDLSFNQLNGELSNFSSPSAQVSLQINRLSGKIPSSYVAMEQINVLDGNIFQCDHESFAQSNTAVNLPTNDPNAKTYLCGSNELNLDVSAWGVCVFLIVGICLVRIFCDVRHRSMIANTLKFLIVDDGCDGSVGEAVGLFWSSSVNWFRMCLGVCGISVCCLIPLYALLKLAYHTYNIQYGWVVSVCFLKGTLSAVLILFCASTMIGLLIRSSLMTDTVVSLRYLHGQQSDVREEPSPSAPDSISDLPLCSRNSVMLWVYIVLDVIIVGVVNGLYVFALQERTNSSLISLLTVALSFFKLACSSVILRSSLASVTSTAYIVLAVLCFNNVIVPILIQCFISTDCFFYATLASTPEVSSDVLVPQCRLVYNPDDIYFEILLPQYITICASTKETISYDPPFMYSYACSSSLIVNFTPVFILRYLWSGLVYPLIQLAAYAILRVESAPAVVKRLAEYVEIERWRIVRHLDEASKHPQLLESISPVAPYDRRKLVAVLLSDVLLLVTFGLFFPPLAVIICVSICVLIADHKLSVQRTLMTAPNAKTVYGYDAWKKFQSRIELEIVKTRPMLVRPVFVISFIASLLWAFVLFDIVGSAAEVVESTLIVLAMCSTCLVWGGLWVWIRNRQHQRKLRYISRTVSNPMVDGTVELNMNSEM